MRMAVAGGTGVLGRHILEACPGRRSPGKDPGLPGQRSRLAALRVPGRPGRAMRSGQLLPPPGARLIDPAFDEWLAGDDVFAVSG